LYLIIELQGEVSRALVKRYFDYVLPVKKGRGFEAGVDRSQQAKLLTVVVRCERDTMVFPKTP
jgi:hypothetical protein